MRGGCCPYHNTGSKVTAFKGSPTLVGALVGWLVGLVGLVGWPGWGVRWKLNFLFLIGQKPADIVEACWILPPPDVTYVGFGTGKRGEMKGKQRGTESDMKGTEMKTRGVQGE